MPLLHNGDLSFVSPSEKKAELSDKYGINAEKKALRRILKEKRAALSGEQRMIFSERLCENVISLGLFKDADAVLSFYPLENETDVRRINEEALRQGKILAFPKCVKGTSEMNFFSVSSLDQLEKGSFSIFEPKDGCPLFVPSDGLNTVCIVPALAYDKQGFRIGYGGGFYDRYLAKHKLKTVGAVYSPFIVDPLMRDEFDLAVDTVVTDREIF